VLLTLIDILSYLIGVLRVIVIIQAVMGLLISFNVINTHNEFVSAVWRGLNLLLEPFYRPLRRILPDTRPIDFSPWALLVLLSILSIVLGHIEISYVAGQ
jgi:YggT family protein